MTVIIFDLDGVIFDSIEIGYQLAIERFPALTRSEHRELSCGNYPVEIAKYALANPPVELTPEQKEERKAYYARMKLASPVFAGIPELLAELHELGHTLVLNTSAYERNTVPLLEKAGILEYFDFLGTIEVAKSKVEKFALVTEKYSVSASEVVFITDTLGDLVESNTSGIPTIAVLWGAHDRSYFGRSQWDNLIGFADTVGELREILLESNNV